MRNFNDPKSSELLAALREGDSRAAGAVHARYLGRLIALARSRLSQRLAARTDAEDIVQSAYRSFFLRAAQGQFALRRSGDLWRLLARITLRKLYRHVEHHQAQQRSVHRDQSLAAMDSDDLPAAQFGADARTPEEAAAVAEQLAACLAELSPLQRNIFELRLEEHTIDEIATQVRRSERTVRRNLETIRRQMRGLLEEAEE